MLNGSSGRSGPNEAARPDALTDLLDRPVTAVRWGLERVTALLEELGRPERGFESFHIAGTNGKGSTAAFGAAVLRAAGFHTGLYTSPHLVDVRERLQVDGAWVDEALLQSMSARVAACEAASEATYFEVLTALAFSCFAECGVTHAVVETGLGGRLDATNVIDPAATAITSIGFDHGDLLGESLEEIAWEKAGIVKPGRPLALGRMGSGPREVVECRAREVGAPVLRLGVDAVVENIETGRTGTRFRYRSARRAEGVELETGAIGSHQAENAGLAVLMLEGPLPELDDATVRTGIGDAYLAGRFEVVSAGETRWVLDVAHNAEGMEAFLVAARAASLPRPWVAVVGILRDKPWRRMLDALRVDMDAIILTQAVSAPVPRRWDAAAGRDHLGSSFPGALHLEGRLRGALQRATELSGRGTVFVTGSAYTVGDARRVLGSGGANDPAGVAIRAGFSGPRGR